VVTASKKKVPPSHCRSWPDVGWFADVIAVAGAWNNRLRLFQTCAATVQG
jgi:hypothetical protein